MTEFGAGKKKNDLGFLNFDLNVDLEPLFNWNVKQLFLYLTAEYETKPNVKIFIEFLINMKPVL
jgi:signal peptidase complex subunit 3